LAVIYLAGCNQVFGLSKTRLVDAAASAPAFVQVQANEVMMGSTNPVAFDRPLAAGDAVIAAVYVEDVALASVVDSQGNTYTREVGPIDDGLTDLIYIYAAFDVIGGPDTVTATASGTSASLMLYVHEYANVVAFDSGNGGPVSSEAIDGMMSGPIVTQAAGELLFGFAVAESTAAGTGFTARSNVGFNVTEDQIAQGPGSYEVTATGTPTTFPINFEIAGAAFTSMR
jgi:hypothetical protein